MKKLKAILDEKMKDPEFCEAFNECEREFQIAQEIVKLRKKSGLTQTELAKRAHTSQSAIARLEAGEHKNITLSFLNRVCMALGTIPEIKLKKLKSA